MSVCAKNLVCGQDCDLKWICCCGCSYALFQLLPALWMQFFTVCCWVICPTAINNYWLLKTDTCANSCLCVFSGLNTTIWKWSELHTLLPVGAQQVQASRVNVVACVNEELTIRDKSCEGILTQNWRFPASILIMVNLIPRPHPAFHHLQFLMEGWAGPGNEASPW